MTSIGLRPALLFFSLTGVNTAASISARKLSNGTTRAIISSGSPFAEIAASRRSASKNPNCPIVPTLANLVVTSQTRTNSRRSLFFEVPHRTARSGAHKLPSTPQHCIRCCADPEQRADLLLRDASALDYSVRCPETDQQWRKHRN